jgi:hypothetical protein
MNTIPKILLALVFAALLTACTATDSENANAAAPNTAAQKNEADANLTKDDVDEFETMVKLPFHPEEALWREEPLGKKDGDQRVPGPTDKKLTAVVKFTREHAEKITEQAARQKPGAPVTMNAENWFPAELIALTQMSGDETLKGTTYAAADFYQPPYLDGKLTRIENSNYFVLELFSK